VPQRAGALLILTQEEGSQAQRLTGRDVPFAMLDADRMAAIKSRSSPDACGSWTHRAPSRSRPTGSSAARRSYKRYASLRAFPESSSRRMAPWARAIPVGVEQRLPVPTRAVLPVQREVLDPRLTAEVHVLHVEVDRAVGSNKYV
jgi:hypothetical protein